MILYDLYDLYYLYDLYDLYDLHDLYDLDLSGEDRFSGIFMIHLLLPGRSRIICVIYNIRPALDL